MDGLLQDELHFRAGRRAGNCRPAVDPVLDASGEWAADSGAPVFA